MARWIEPTTILRIVCDSFGNLVRKTLDRSLARAAFGPSFFYLVLHNIHANNQGSGFSIPTMRDFME